MLQKTMTLKEMMDYQPSRDDFGQLPDAYGGLMRLCVVAPSQEKAYGFLRHMMNSPYRRLCLDTFHDCLNTVHYDFDGTQTERQTFILMAEYQVTADASSLEALMEDIIETKTDDDVEIIADCFMKEMEEGSCLRIYSHEGKAQSARLG